VIRHLGPRKRWRFEAGSASARDDYRPARLAGSAPIARRVDQLQSSWAVKSHKVGIHAAGRWPVRRDVDVEITTSQVGRRDGPLAHQRTQEQARLDILREPEARGSAHSKRSLPSSFPPALTVFSRRAIGRQEREKITNAAEEIKLSVEWHLSGNYTYPTVLNGVAEKTSFTQLTLPVPGEWQLRRSDSNFYIAVGTPLALSRILTRRPEAGRVCHLVKVVSGDSRRGHFKVRPFAAAIDARARHRQPCPVRTRGIRMRRWGQAKLKRVGMDCWRMQQEL